MIHAVEVRDIPDERPGRSLVEPILRAVLAVPPGQALCIPVDSPQMGRRLSRRLRYLLRDRGLRARITVGMEREPGSPGGAAALAVYAHVVGKRDVSPSRRRKRAARAQAERP